MGRMTKTLERIRKIVIKTRQDFGSLEVAKKDCKKTFRIGKKEKNAT